MTSPRPSTQRDQVEPTSRTVVELARPERVVVEGIAFDAVTEDEAVAVVREGMTARRGGVVLTPNVDILRTLRWPDRRNLAERAELVVADGTPILWAARLRGTPLPERVTGAALVGSLTGVAAQDQRSVYLLGGEDGVAERGAAVLVERFPGITVAGWHCPPHGFDEDQDLLQVIVDDLVRTQPDLVLVGLGFPKQERLAEVLRRHLPHTWFLGCGAGLAFLAGDVPRAPSRMQSAGLEWVFRLRQEPRRLARRYLVDDTPYAVAMLGRATLQGLRARRSAA